MPYIFGKLWHLAIIWAIRKAFQCILQGVRFLLANHTRLSPTSDNDSYQIFPKPKPRLFSETKLLQNRNRYFFSETKFSDTETETFKKLAKVSKPRSFETEMSISVHTPPLPYETLVLFKRNPNYFLNRKKYPQRLPRILIQEFILLLLYYLSLRIAHIVYFFPPYSKIIKNLL